MPFDVTLCPHCPNVALETCTYHRPVAPSRLAAFAGPPPARVPSSAWAIGVFAVLAYPGVQWNASPSGWSRRTTAGMTASRPTFGTITDAMLDAEDDARGLGFVVPP